MHECALFLRAFKAAKFDEAAIFCYKQRTQKYEIQKFTIKYKNNFFFKIWKKSNHFLKLIVVVVAAAAAAAVAVVVVGVVGVGSNKHKQDKGTPRYNAQVKCK